MTGFFDFILLLVVIALLAFIVLKGMSGTLGNILGAFQ